MTRPEVDTGALLRRLDPLAGRLGRRTLRTAGARAGLRWVPDAAPESFRPERVFLTPGWCAHHREPGGFLHLALVDGGQRRGLLTVRDLWLPGGFRQWEALVEPDLLDGAVSQAMALAALIRLARRNRVDLLQSFSNMARWTAPDLDRCLAGGEVLPFGTYTVDLRGGHEAVVAGMHGQHRRLMRKARRAGVEVRDTVDADAFLALIDETYTRGGKTLPFPRPYLRRLITAPRVPLLVASAQADGALHSAVLVPYDRRRGYYLHGASRTRAAPGASVLAHLRVMERLAEVGVPTYDLGGARRETGSKRLAGIFRFKRHFGGPFEDCVRWRLPLSARGRALRWLARRLSGPD